MVVTGHVNGLGHRLAVHHVVVALVGIRRVVIPVVSTQMMVGIDAVLLVLPGDAVLNDIPRSRHALGDGAHAVAAALDARTVAARHQIGIVAVLPGPAAVHHHGRIVVNQVEAVVAVTPRTASANHVVGMRRTRQVEPEAVAVAACPVFRHRVVVVVGITIEHQVVAAPREIDADAHSVVDVHLLNHTIATPAHRDILALRVAGDGHLNANDVELLQPPVVAFHVESADALFGGLHQREVNHRLFVLVSADGDGFLCRSAGRQVIHAGIEIALLISHYLSLRGLVGAFAQIDGGARRGLTDGFL